MHYRTVDGGGGSFFKSGFDVVVFVISQEISDTIKVRRLDGFQSHDFAFHTMDEEFLRVGGISTYNIFVSDIGA